MPAKSKPPATNPPKKEETPPVKPKEEPKKAEPSKSPGYSYESLERTSIGKRIPDCFFILAYLAWAFVAFVLFFARCRLLLPKTVNEVEFAQPVCEALEKLEGPLRPFVESHQQWGAKVFNVKTDFTLDLVNYANFLFLAPFAILLALGFTGGYKWVRNIALVHAAIMLYNMIAVDIYAFEVLLQSDFLDIESAAFGGFVIYSFYTIFPLVVMKRVWGDSPFSAKKVPRRGFIVRSFSFLVKAMLFIWMVSAAIGIYEFSVKHTTSMKHMPSVIDTSKESWVKAAPYRQQLMVHAAEFQVWAGQKVIEGAAATQALMIDVGERVVAWVQSLQSKEGAKNDPPAQPQKQEVKRETAPPNPPQPPKKPQPPSEPKPPKQETAAPPAPPKVETPAEGVKQRDEL